MPCMRRQRELRSQKAAVEHHARPRVLHQENVDPKELRVHCGHEGQAKERGAHDDGWLGPGHQYPVPTLARLRSCSWRPPFFARTSQACEMSSASVVASVWPSVSLTSARMILM